MIINSLLLTYLVLISNGNKMLIQPAIINSTGEYYITDMDSAWRSEEYQLEIRCNTNKLCHIQCNNHQSCIGITIHCNNASSCLIDCNEYTACQGAKFFVGFHQTTINCLWSSCSSIGENSSIIYTNFNTYPSSYIALNCKYNNSCNGINIVDVRTGNYSYLNSSNFKIFCSQRHFELHSGWKGCTPNLSSSYPVATPTTINSTGEYYSNFGAYVNIECNHESLCHIDCSGGSCTKSNIHCVDSNKCLILAICTYSYICTGMNITAQNNQIFDFTCTGSGRSCAYSSINVVDVMEFNFNCTGTSTGDCVDTLINIVNVNHTLMGLGADTSWGLTINAKSIEKFDVQSAGNHEMNWSLNNVGLFNGYLEDCHGIWHIANGTHANLFANEWSTLDIVTNGFGNEVELFCGNYSCSNAYICTQAEDILNICCYGVESCNEIEFCAQTKNPVSVAITAQKSECNSIGESDDLETRICIIIAVAVFVVVVLCIGLCIWNQFSICKINYATKFTAVNEKDEDDDNLGDTLDDQEGLMKESTINMVSEGRETHYIE